MIPDAASAIPAGCACCAAGTTNVAEMDRQAHRAKFDATYADMLALLDRTEIQVARLLPAVGRRLP